MFNSDNLNLNKNINEDKNITILFTGDIFGDPGLKSLKTFLPLIKEKYNYDFLIAQCENVSGRKGLRYKEYLKLKKLGVDALTFGNHVWAKDEIYNFINNPDMIRPLNIDDTYPGQGSRIFHINNITLRVSALMGISFNKLLSPWKHEYANNFFDAIDPIIAEDEKNKNVDFHIMDFHGETTSEKNVFSLYLDGKVDAFLGTHTHVQTNDARILDNGTCYITDAGMTGPTNCAIGANYQEVYEKMRFNSLVRFKVSKNICGFNGVILKLHTTKKHEIMAVNLLEKKI